ncbi:hypothetical protein R1flu_018750 [Riccia fluitans]|uniref:IMS import disulfide relay-system CHCH-CHCH-like Cx9C domain-containing protein n=1 Tax=Riccia fluitans TaxID=41844 RepID=A0ABD1ZGY8_9MARC
MQKWQTDRLNRPRVVATMNRTRTKTLSGQAGKESDFSMRFASTWILDLHCDWLSVSSGSMSAYGQCVATKVPAVEQGMCAKEFRSLIECVQKATLSKI